MSPPLPKGRESVLGQRPSKTARALFEAKMKRANAMTARERMKLALELGRGSKDKGSTKR